MKKILYSITILFQIVFLIGCKVFEKYANTRMGMHRWVTYTNRNLERDYPIESLKIALIGILIVFTIIAIILLIQNTTLKKNYNLFGKLMGLLTIIINIFLLKFILTNTQYTNSSYFFLIMMLSMVSILQIIKLIVYTKMIKE
ncbi:hypothetical protein ACTPC6_14425 [Clostridioides difficile]|nr:hypothetical protein [Clostridioides difficile]MDB0440246.1 hypothetical protein [Clostridioides difficile]